MLELSTVLEAEGDSSATFGLFKLLEISATEPRKWSPIGTTVLQCRRVALRFALCHELVGFLGKEARSFKCVVCRFEPSAGLDGVSCVESQKPS